MAKENNMAFYNEMMNDNPVLSAEQEKELGFLAMKGDKHARDKLVLSNLKFVVMVANHYSSFGVDFNDIVQAGIEGLILAVDHYNPSKNNRFVYYANFWITRVIEKEINNCGKNIKLPERKFQQAKKIHAIYSKLSNVKSTDEKLNKICTMTNMKKSDAEMIFNISNQPLSLDSFISDSSDNTFESFEKDSSTVSPEENCVLTTMKDDVNKSLDCLSKTDRDIIMRRFGFNNCKPQSCTEIAKAYGYTKSWVSFHEKKAISTLRKAASELEEYVA